MMIATRTLSLRICALGILMLFEPLRLSVVLPLVGVLLTVRVPLPALLEARAAACRPTLKRTSQTVTSMRRRQFTHMKLTISKVPGLPDAALGDEPRALMVIVCAVFERFT